MPLQLGPGYADRDGKKGPPLVKGSVQFSISDWRTRDHCEGAACYRRLALRTISTMNASCLRCAHEMIYFFLREQEKERFSFATYGRDPPGFYGLVNSDKNAFSSANRELPIGTGQSRCDHIVFAEAHGFP